MDSRLAWILRKPAEPDYSHRSMWDLDTLIKNNAARFDACTSAARPRWLESNEPWLGMHYRFKGGVAAVTFHPEPAVRVKYLDRIILVACVRRRPLDGLVEAHFDDNSEPEHKPQLFTTQDEAGAWLAPRVLAVLRREMPDNATPD